MKIKLLKNNLASIITQEKKFLELLMILLLTDYVILFATESILPGLVMRFFNLNILLATVLVIWFGLFLAKDKKNQSAFPRMFSLLLWLTAFMFVLSLFFGFIGIGFFEMTVYFILIFILFKLFMNFFDKPEK